MTIQRRFAALILGLIVSASSLAALVVADRVKETTTTSGTGTVNLAGAAAGYQGFVAGIGNANTTTYGLIDGTAWEIGQGTVTDASPDTLSRDTIIASSNGGSAISLSGGTTQVFVTYPGSVSKMREVLAVRPGVEVQAYDADLDDLADGSLTGSKVGTGISATNVTTGDMSGDRVDGGTITNFASTGVDDNADALACTIDSSERVICGHTSSVTVKRENGGTGEGVIQANSNSTTNVLMQSIAWNAVDSIPTSLVIAKGSSDTIGTMTSAASGEQVADIVFGASDGTDFEPVAVISVEMDAAVGNNDAPGSIIIKTTPDGSTVPTRAITFDSNQNTVLGGALAAGVGGKCSANITSDAAASLSVTGCGYYSFTSDSATSTSRTFCLDAGIEGQIIWLFADVSGTNEIELGDGAAGACSGSTGAATFLNGVWPAATNQNNDAAAIMYRTTASGAQANGWYELHRAAN